MNSHLSLRGLLVISFSFILALILSILPFPASFNFFWPQWMVLVLVYWVIALPHRINMGVAWLLGLLMDGLFGSLVGEHALALSVIAYLADRFHRQLRMFPLLQQSVMICLLVLIYQLLLLWIQGIRGLLADAYWFWLPALTSMLLWPWAFMLLRSYRRRFRVQ
jgi:rod shape-determining protein MreD